KGITATCRFSSFRHVGVFPEQMPLWEWMLDALPRGGPEPPRLLNLFAYTGVASLLAAAAGAHVTHVDASKRAIDWAKENQAASGGRLRGGGVARGGRGGEGGLSRALFTGGRREGG